LKWPGEGDVKRARSLGGRTLAETNVDVCDQNTSKCRFSLFVNRRPAKS